MRVDIVNCQLKSDHYLIEMIKKQSKFTLENIIGAKSYWIETNQEGHDKKFIEDLLRDPVDELLLTKEIDLNSIDYNYLIEVSFKPGVTDNRAKSTAEAINDHFGGLNFKVATGNLYFVKTGLNREIIEKVANDYFANPLIQRIKVFTQADLQSKIPSPSFPDVHITSHKVEEIDLSIDTEQLKQLGDKKLWALSSAEIDQIKMYYNEESVSKERTLKNLPKNATDLEIEIIAQSWSEHCKHKIFNAEIQYTENEDTKYPIGNKKVTSLFKDYIFKATEDVKQKFGIDWLVSVFKDNAGIVRFDKSLDLCFKVETHNSPSALDPYGGALTGILGVNRDIYGCGIGSMPIANTNVLCFAPLNYSKETLQKLPAKLKHPLTLLKGVHKGIEDGGNKSGIPTINGAIHFHDNYAGKPLVYCGTVGALPQTIKGIPTSEKRHVPGDYIVVCGGSVGADGVHGATFSSIELDDNSPSTAVQIGDPFTQKRLGDFLIEARDSLLYSSITDNGAGGLSSSVGEMAEHTGGATIELEKVPLKYNGLTPYEIIISESQERMTFAVPEGDLDSFMELAIKRNVNPAVIGQFHDNGNFEVKQNGSLIASLSLDFLHNSLKPMKLKAHFEGGQPDLAWHNEFKDQTITDLSSCILNILAHPNIKSKESLVRQYDHEVKGSTVVKPFISNILSSPSDAGVMSTALFGGSKKSAIAISNGLCPQYSHIDTYYMTQLAIDEAVRNAVASGANPNYICLCDNFCWPDPIQSHKTPDGEHKLAQLVRAGQSLYDTAMVYGTPFVSGKDSMKNDFMGVNPNGDNIKISVPPTLLISALGKLDTIDDFMTSEFKQENDYVFYIGPEHFKQTYFSTNSPSCMDLPPIDLNQNKDTFSLIHKLIKNKVIKSCHDVSEGGIITSVIESSFANNFGFEFSPDLLKEDEIISNFLFNELSGGFIISIDEAQKENLMKELNSTSFRFLGKTTNQNIIKYKDEFNIAINELYKQWSKDDY